MNANFTSFSFALCKPQRADMREVVNNDGRLLFTLFRKNRFDLFHRNLDNSSRSKHETNALSSYKIVTYTSFIIKYLSL
jgi:hypothetical protein